MTGALDVSSENIVKHSTDAMITIQIAKLMAILPICFLIKYSFWVVLHIFILTYKGKYVNIYNN